MSRRTPIKELIEEDSVTGSPRRKSSRIAAKTTDDKEVSTTAAKNTRSKQLSFSQDTNDLQKDDDESSVSSNASSNKRLTRAASKSPSRTNATDGPARRTRRAASTSSLQDANNTVSSPAPKRRLSSRSVSTSPSAEIQESNITRTPRMSRSLKTPPPADTGTAATAPAKPRTRRPSFSDKITPMESIEEKQNRSEESKELETAEETVDLTIDDDDNLPFKKKRKALNLQTIEEKSFVEDTEDKTDKVESTDTGNVTKALPKFSLSLLKNKDDQEEQELIDILEKTATTISEVDTNKKPIEVENKPSEANDTADSDSVFLNSSIDSEAKVIEPALSSSITSEKPTSGEVVRPDSSVVTDKDVAITADADKQTKSPNTSEKVSHKEVKKSTEYEVDVPIANNSNATTTEESIAPEPDVTNETAEVISHNVSKTVEADSVPVGNETESPIEVANVENRSVESEPAMATKDSEVPIDTNAEPATELIETEQIISASPSPKQTESIIQPKSGRRSLSDSEKPSPNNSKPLSSISSNLESKLSEVSSSLPLNILINNNEIIKENGLNVSGSSDLSNKENQKHFTVNGIEEVQKSKSFSGTLKESSFYEPMEVEYASDIDKTVSIVTSEVISSPKRRSSRLLQKAITDYAITSSTPKKRQSAESTTVENLVQDTNILIEINDENEVANTKSTPDKEKKTGTSKQMNTENSKIAESSVVDSTVDESVVDSEIDRDEYEENHASIVHSSDEEAAAAERSTYTKTSPPFKMPDRNKHPLLSDGTYEALVVTADESDKSDDPDFEVTTFGANSDIDNSFKDINAKIDDLIAKHDDGESSSEESVTNFLDEYAEEGEEDTPSEGSNDIVEIGESIGSNDTEIVSDASYDETDDSFIDDTEQVDLLSGGEYNSDHEVENKRSSKRRSRIVKLSDSEDEIIVNGEIHQDDDLEKMSTRPYCGLSPPSVISIRDSPSIEEKENDAESVTSVLINKEDNLQSLEEIKQISPAKNTLVVKKSPVSVEKIADASTPNNSLTEDSSKPRKRLSSIRIQDNITVDDIEHGGVGDRINKVIDAFYASVKESSLNVSGSFSLNISLDCVKSPGKDSEQVFDESETQVEQEVSAFKPDDQRLAEDEVTLLMATEKPKKSKKRKSLNNDSETIKPVEVPIVSKIPVRQKEESRKNKEVPELIVTSVEAPSTRQKLKGKKSSLKDKLITSDCHKLPEVQLENKDEPKPKKTKQKFKDVPIIETAEIIKNLKPKKSKKKKVPARSDEFDTSADLDMILGSAGDKESKHAKKRKRHVAEEEQSLEVKQVKKAQGSDELVLNRRQKSRRIVESQYSEWVVEKANIDYFPSSLLNMVVDKKTKKSNKVESKPTIVPSTSQDRMSWGYTRSKNLFPSTTNQTSTVDYVETFSSKDFKNRMLFDPSRVKRENMKTYLKKKEKTKI